MSNIVPFPIMKRNPDMDDQKVQDLMEKILEETQSKATVVLTIKDDGEVNLMWNGNFNTHELIYMCSLGIYEAHSLERNEGVFEVV